MKKHLNLQFFADPVPAGTDPVPTPAPTPAPTPTPQSLDDVLKNPKYQSEFDKKIAKALETAHGKWEAEYAAKLEQAKSEAQKLAKMNQAEKEKYEMQKRQDDLAAREREVTKRELRATAIETLNEKNLPKELAEILNYEDADKCKASIDAVTKAFQTSVEKAVNDRLRGNGAPQGTNGKPAEKKLEDMTYTEQVEYLQKINK